MQVYDFVEWELQKFRNECNFTEEELQCFELKAKNKSNEYISQNMHISIAKNSTACKTCEKQNIKSNITSLTGRYFFDI